MSHCLGLWCVGLLAEVDLTGSALESWGKWGLAGLIILYALWRDWKRDEWVKEQMLGALRENTAALREHASAGERQTAVMTRLAEQVGACPKKRE